MTPENFCYWLQGLLELEPSLDILDAAKTKMIREHLRRVFEPKIFSNQLNSPIVYSGVQTLSELQSIQVTC